MAACTLSCAGSCAIPASCVLWLTTLSFFFVLLLLLVFFFPFKQHGGRKGSTALPPIAAPRRRPQLAEVDLVLPLPLATLGLRPNPPPRASPDVLVVEHAEHRPAAAASRASERSETWANDPLFYEKEIEEVRQVIIK